MGSQIYYWQDGVRSSMDFTDTASYHDQDQMIDTTYQAASSSIGDRIDVQHMQEYAQESSMGKNPLSDAHSQLSELDYLPEPSSSSISHDATLEHFSRFSRQNVDLGRTQPLLQDNMHHGIPNLIQQSSNISQRFVQDRCSHPLPFFNQDTAFTMPFISEYGHSPAVPSQPRTFQPFIADSKRIPTEETFSAFPVQQFTSPTLAHKMEAKLSAGNERHFPGDNLDIRRYLPESTHQAVPNAIPIRSNLFTAQNQEQNLVYSSQSGHASFITDVVSPNKFASKQCHGKPGNNLHYSNDTPAFWSNSAPYDIIKSPSEAGIKRDRIAPMGNVDAQSNLRSAYAFVTQPEFEHNSSHQSNPLAKRQCRTAILEARPPSPSSSVSESDSEDDEDGDTQSESKPAARKKSQTQRKVGKGSGSKRSLQDVISADQQAIKCLAIPLFPNGIQHYVLTRNGYTYDPRFNTQEDLRRWVSMRVTELQILGPQDHHTEKSKFKIETFPFSAVMHRMVVDQPQFWLTGTVINCADYNYTAKMIESGSIQAAVNKFRHTSEQVEKMWLLILLRLAASCKPAGHLLKFAINDIYGFLLDILSQSNEHFSTPIKKRQLSDSRGYDYFLVTALASHLRPLLGSTKDLPFDKEVAYRNQVKLLLAAYKEKASSSTQEFIASLPNLTAQYFESLTMHDMATEIFVDLAKFGFMTHFAASVINIRWGRALTRLLWHRGFDSVTITMCQVIHQAPSKVISKIENPCRLFVRCFKYLTWALRTILDNEFYQLPGHERQFVPMAFIISCAKALIAMHKNGELSDTNKAVIEFIRNESNMAKLVRYVLTVPFCEGLLQDEDHKELYECLWSLIHNAAYTFPMMMETLTEFACDKDVPLNLSGHAAMFIGSVIVFAKYEVTYKQVLSIYNTLKRYSIDAPNEASRNLRLELIFRLSILLEGEKYELKHSLCDHRETEDVNKARSAFSSYTFKEFKEPCRVPGLPRKVRINAVSLFEEGCVEIVHSDQTRLTVDDGKFPVLTFQQQPDGSIVRKRSIKSLSETSCIQNPENPSVETPNLKLKRGESGFTLNGEALDSGDEDEVPIVDAQNTAEGHAANNTPHALRNLSSEP